MGANKLSADAAASFFDDISPERDVQNEQAQKQAKGTEAQLVAAQRRSNEARYGIKPVHINATLFPDDLQALKDIAYEKRISTSELIRDIIIPEYIKKHRK